jgi:dihydrofolate synthase/folylpolyglutamate synthase
METPLSPPGFEKVLADYRQKYQWLLSLVTDPSGARYFTDKSREQRLLELEEQLARTADFLHFIGDPQKRFNAVHVAGTSGKGSVVSLLAAMLTASGLKTGHHISPYLQVPDEKLVVDDRMISPSGFSALVSRFQEEYRRWQQAGGKYDSLKYVEAWVILTYIWLAERGVDWAVIETALGGRFDPTNVLPSRLAVLTNINYDHTEVLGETLNEIAWHKAGIIKSGGIAITAETKAEPLAVFRREAQEKGVLLFELDQDYSYRVDEISNEGVRVSVNGPYHSYPNLQVPLTGLFQPLNVALAVAALDVLRQEYRLPVNQETVQAGLQAVRFPGRMEVVQRKPLVILDGAHNLHKMQSLVESLAELYPGCKFTVVIGMLSVKDAQGMIATLAPLAERWVASQPQVYGKPAMAAQELAERILQAVPGGKVLVCPRVPVALDAALENASPDDMVLVTGSLYLLGEARNRWYPTEQLLRELEANK